MQTNGGNIPRRKVAIYESSPLSNQSHNTPQRQLCENQIFNNNSKKLQRHEHGWQRLKIANYVQNQLQTNRQRDIQILEKFRKEAQEAKKEKYRQKRKINNYKKIGQINNSSRLLNIQQAKNTNTQVLLQNVSLNQTQYQQKHSEQIKMVRHNKQFQRSIQRKLKQQHKELKNIVKEIKHTDIQRVNSLLQGLSSKVSYQRSVEKKLQEQHKELKNIVKEIKHTDIQRVNSLLQVLSSKVAQNSILLNQSLIQLQQIKKKVTYEKHNSEHKQNIPLNIYKKQKPIIEKLKYQDRQSQKKLPSIYYSMPKTYENKNKMNLNDYHTRMLNEANLAIYKLQRKHQRLYGYDSYHQ